MKIISGLASRDLGLKISHLLGAKTIPMEFKRFPDGELYIRFNEEVKGEESQLGSDEPEKTPKRVARPRRRQRPLDQERMASRQRAHEFKVAQFLSGGK